ncbi:glyoxylase-like metal-dependent hydrolase (beta-lactamase superfamily II) [Halopolyspora algeriensis]|uniref:Glyoxylase-like metal-dependent hydrolase (Beta-lactamase superfamily II) n=1 Tax=Halopolyspora algeriensis TaxID=1500506 RepID=A0A368VHH7_9ACTN|nr:MBL fold metallo-hydrolase [Halopolyspora algeriensis]RCW40708.1 glyoxylase-like metal-dependent hydrolase (beta-lactamase superfamily II) [Halopolyspora algeriensis]TQM53369.1 glyoxylase-like metal-dependent hydrolase (beta-lactamase superfamily II) [Halopolyspora algeriensis]
MALQPVRGFTHPLPGNLDVEVIETSSLGDRSYLATDGDVAVVVDPQRDVDRILATAGRLGVRVTLVLETHVHNDYVSGGLELARLTGAEYGLAAADEVPFARRPLSDGDVVELSDRMQVRVLDTPGHTFHHLSYALEGVEGSVGVFTGGSLLYGTTGRTDLAGEQHSETLARHQHTSAHKLGALLPDGARIWPTHGFGSFCSAASVSGDSGTIGEQYHLNPALTLAEGEFVEQTLAGLDTYPAYYAHMGVLNTTGPAPLDLRPPARATPEELARRLEHGEWVVDLRSRKAYVASHLASTVSLGLDGSMATWLGWMIEWEAPIVLLGESPEQVGQAQRELARIGIDTFSAAAVGSPRRLAAEPGQLRSMDSATFADLAHSLSSRGEPSEDGRHPTPDVVLDVRTNNEWNSSHVEGAVHIPLYELTGRLRDIPSGTVWVHCGSGYRAAAAASILEGAGRTVVLLDDAFSSAAHAGVPLAGST